MTEVTRVPLQPIAKGSLLKLWLGVIIAVLIAAGIAWAAMPKGLSVTTITAGEGTNPTAEDVVFVEYVGTLDNGDEFDRSPPRMQLPPEIAPLIPEGVPMPLESVVAGFAEGLMQTREGGVYTIEIPADMAYGDEPPPGSDIPAGADLNFQVTVHKVMSRAEFEQLAGQVQMLMMQAQMEAQGGASEQGPGPQDIPQPIPQP